MDIEWEDLQQAFLSTRTDREFYLDRETGEVISLSESEEEEDSSEDGEEEAEEGEPGEEETIREEMDNDPDRFVQVFPIATSDRTEWMAAFLQTVKVKELLGPLAKAANGNNPDRDFDRLLRQNPLERARWLGFLERQVQEIIDGWTEENDLEPETPPPWKLNAPRRLRKKAES